MPLTNAPISRITRHLASVFNTCGSAIRGIGAHASGPPVAASVPACPTTYNMTSNLADKNHFGKFASIYITVKTNTQFS